MVMFSTIYIEGPMKLKLMGMETRVGQVAKRNEYRTKSGTKLLSCLESVTLALVFIRYVVLLGPSGSVGLK